MDKPRRAGPALPPQVTVNTRRDAHSMLVELQRTNMLALGLEADQPYNARSTAQALHIATARTWYVIPAAAMPHVRPLLPLLQDPKRLLIMHQGKYVLRYIANSLQYNQPLGTMCGSLFDTYIADQLLQAATTGGDVAALLARYAPDAQHKASALAHTVSAAAPPVPLLFPLRTAMRQQLIDSDMVQVAKLEFDLVPVIADMERVGIYLHLPAWHTTWRTIRQRRDKLAATLQQTLGANMPRSLFGTALLNLDSPGQVLAALRQHGIDVPHTNEAVLKQHAATHPVVRNLLQYREYNKAITTWGDVFPNYIHDKTGRIHATYQQIGARTGRMSCTSPNIQQVPRNQAIRSCFQAQDGCTFIVADYSQVELRVAAALAGDERMIEAYRTGTDLHRLTASLLMQTESEHVDNTQRDAAKAVNFGLLYAMGAPGLARYAQKQYGVHMTVQQAEAFRRRFFQAYRGLRRWHERAKYRLHNKQPQHAIHEVRTVAGRRFISKGDVGLAWFLNSPVQGSAADLMKRAMLRVHHALVSYPQARIVAVVHDELLVEAPTEHAGRVARIVQQEMEAAGADLFANVPFQADVTVAPHWGGAS